MSLLRAVFGKILLLAACNARPRDYIYHNGWRCIEVFLLCDIIINRKQLLSERS